LPFSNETEILFKFANADPSMNAIVRGITRDINGEYANALDVILFNCESFSKEIDKSDLQEEKHFGPRNSRHLGMMIDFKAEKENAFDSILFSCETFSNETVESDLQ
jgi:hypothetical protein